MTPDITRGLVVVAAVLVLSLVSGSPTSEGAVTGPARFNTNLKAVARHMKHHAAEAEQRVARKSPAAATVGLVHATYALANASTVKALIGTDAFGTLAGVEPAAYITHLERLQDAAAKRMAIACPKLKLKSVPVTPTSMIA